MASKLKLTELLYPTSTTPAITLNSDNTVTFGASTTTITNLSATSITDSGNLNFTGTGGRITGDFSNGTIANRVAFQTSTVNGVTNLHVLPNGTGTVAGLKLESNSSAVDCSTGSLDIISTGVFAISSNIRGTGTYLPMTFFTGGTEKLRIAADTTGTYTFGGTAPRITGDFSNVTAPSRLAFQTSTTNGGTLINLIPNGTSVDARFIAFENSADISNSSFAAFGVVNNEYRMAAGVTGTGTFRPMTFNTGGGEAMRINTVRNVGIGTSGNTTSRVDVSAATNNYAATFYANTGAGVTAGLNSYGLSVGGNVSGGSAEVNLIYGSAGGGLAFNSFNGTTITERMRLDQSGNLGLGVTPSAWGAGWAPIQFSGDVSVSRAGIGRNTYYDGSAYRYIGTAAATLMAQSSGVFQWFNAPSGTAGNAISFTQAMTLNASGELSVGTTASGARFRVDSAGNTNATQAIQINNSSVVEMFRIRNDGAIFTGTSSSGLAACPYNNTTANAANMVVGTGGDLQRSTSSLRYKTNVQDATHGLADVMALRSVTYKGKNDGETVFGGLIAEEVDEAGLTEFVVYDADGKPDALHYGNMVSLAFKAIQELKAEFDAYKLSHP